MEIKKDAWKVTPGRSVIIGYPVNHQFYQALGQHIEPLKDLLTETVTSLTLNMDGTFTQAYVVKNEAITSLKTANKVVGKLPLKEKADLLLDSFQHPHLVYEAVQLALYEFSKVPRKKAPKASAFEVYVKDLEALTFSRVISEAINVTKDLVNTPYNYLNALDLADLAKTYARYPHTTVEILEKEAIEKLGMGAFLAVNKGSLIPPRLIHIKYRNGGSSPLTAVVGKGVMYDTGGYSLKPSTSMPTMKMDMGGAANVMGIFHALAHLDAPVNADGIILATDNKIGDNAIVPDDIVIAADGTSIEIVSTDAEGRLTLADALWYAQQQKADRIIDMATLTGAVIGALGSEHVGAFTNHPDYLDKFIEKATKSEEKVWPLPQDESHIEGLKSHVADLKNSGVRVAGASVAAAFLNHFVDAKVPWIHLDVAGVTYESKNGATGRVVKAVTEFLIENVSL
jgi:leucyl aminopeptidase